MGYMDNMTDLGTVAGVAAPVSAGAAVNPVTALGGLGMSVASALYGNRMAKKRQNEAFDQQKWMMQNRYQMQVKDLQAAGLNPMLAYTQGAPMPSSVGQAPSHSPDMVAALSTATLSSAQASKTRQETENLKIENNNLRNTSQILMKQISKIDAEVEEIDTKIKLNKASESEINRRTELLSLQKELVAIQAKLGAQELDIKTPEQIASGTHGAAVSATVSRILKPIIDILGGTTRAFPVK